MRSFTKGIFFGALIGGLTTLLTMEKDGKENRKRLATTTIATSKDLQRLVISSHHLQTLSASLQQEVIPQMQQVTTEIADTLTKFQQMNQPRINRIKWRTLKLQEDLNRLQTKE